MMWFIYYMLAFELFYLIQYGLYRIIGRVPLFTTIFRYFEKIGVWFHEIAHFLMMKLLHTPAKIKRIEIDQHGGKISFEYTRRASFFQVLFVCLAPLILGSIAIIGITFLFTASGRELSTLTKIILFIIGFSIISVISPSGPDLKRVVENLRDYPGIALRQLIFLIISWFLEIEIMNRFDVSNPLVEFPLQFALLMVMELIYDIVARLFRFERKNYVQNPSSLTAYRNDIIVQNYLEQDIMGFKAKMTASDDPRFKQRFGELMDTFYKTNSEE